MANPANRSLFAMILAVVVVIAVTAIAVVVYLMNRDAVADVDAPDIAVVDQETGAIVVGSGDHVLETYVDFMCPYCGEFERSWGSEIAQAVDDGSIELRVYPLGFLDAQSDGTEYSSRAASSLYCLADEDPDAILPYMSALFADQPVEGSPGLSDAELLAHAADVGVSSGSFQDCVTAQTHKDLIGQLNGTVPVNPATGRRGIPTVLLDGERIEYTDGPGVLAAL
jgi:protein-disulfide isomerase